MAARDTVPVAGTRWRIPLRRAVPPWLVPWALLAVAGLLTGLVGLALAGAAVNDAGIDARTGRATAQVLAVTSTRTLVRFATPDGQVYSPDEGVAYPSGLRVGQLVRVEYDRANPEQVRVAGRSWVVGATPATITVGALWLLVSPLAWWLRRRCHGDGPGPA